MPVACFMDIIGNLPIPFFLFVLISLIKNYLDQLFSVVDLYLRCIRFICAFTSTI